MIKVNMCTKFVTCIDSQFDYKRSTVVVLFLSRIAMIKFIQCKVPDNRPNNSYLSENYTLIIICVYKISNKSVFTFSTRAAYTNGVKFTESNIV